LRLSAYVKNHSIVGDNEQAAIKLFPDDTKMVFEFCNLIVQTYGEQYGVTFDDFSKEPRFTRALKIYIQ